MHGSIYEFIRNNALDAPNYFDQGSAPPFQRNQFGAALGGPIQTDKTFFFVNYEGFDSEPAPNLRRFRSRSRLARPAVPSVQPLLNLWITPPANAPDFNGIAQVFSSPLQTIRENFGNARVDHVFSSKDTFSAAYTIDDGNDFTPTTANPYSTDILTLREQVATLEETHVFSSDIVERGAVRLFAGRLLLHRRADSRNSCRHCSRFSTGRPRGRGRCRRQCGLQSAGADWPGGQQQRKQSDASRAISTPTKTR